MSRIPSSSAEPPVSRSEESRARRIGAALDEWFSANGRKFIWRGTTDPYVVAVSEMLLQRTRAGAVEGFLPGFLARYPDWNALRSAGRDELENRLKTLGIQRRRSEALLLLANSMISDPDALLETRPGVGEYARRAISVALDSSREAMVDSNFVRIVHRAFSGPWRADYRFDSRMQGLALAVVSIGDAKRINWAVMDLGATVCVPRKPDCASCPLTLMCQTGLEHLSKGGY
jgi:A/G-specific adenine glycosylase